MRPATIDLVTFGHLTSGAHPLRGRPFLASISNVSRVCLRQSVLITAEPEAAPTLFNMSRTVARGGSYFSVSTSVSTFISLGVAIAFVPC